MAFILKRAEGDNSFIDFRLRDKNKQPVTLSLFSSIDLLLERDGLALETLPRFIDDDAGGIGHWEPTVAQVSKGSHRLRVSMIEIATGVNKKFPKDEAVKFLVDGKLVSNP